MKMALAMLALFATLVTIIATVLVLAAFGLGKALSLVLPFSVFEASLLSMLAMWPALWAVWRIVTSGQNDDIQQAWADEQDEDDEVDYNSKRPISSKDKRAMILLCVLCKCFLLINVRIVRPFSP